MTQKTNEKEEKRKAVEHVFQVFLRLAFLWLKLLVIFFIVFYFSILFIRWLI